MDRELWALVMASIRRASRSVGWPGRRRPTFPTWLIVAMELWRVWHNQSLSWACDRSHYGGLFRPRKRTEDGRCLPSVSRFARRVKSDAARAVLQRVHDELSGRGVDVAGLRYVDGKPLPVSPVSKDPDAARGRVSGGYAKGYKLHAFITAGRRVAVWSVTPLNVAEQSVAAEMLPHLPPAAPDALWLADGNYDSAPLHKGPRRWGRGRGRGRGRSWSPRSRARAGSRAAPGTR